VTCSRTSRVIGLVGRSVLVASLLGASACGGSSSSSSSSPASPSTPTQPAATVRYVSVTGSFAIGSAGGTTQLQAVANTTAGTQDVTSQATWSSSNDAVATVSSGGLVSAKGTGLALITASYQGFSGYGGISVATAVNVTGTWSGTSVNPTSSITLQLTQTGDSVSGNSTTLGGSATYNGSLTGSVIGGMVILAGSVADANGSTYSTWTDERCALENANSMRCVNPMTLAGGSFSLLQVTLGR
jgi:hypothetical protein